MSRTRYGQSLHTKPSCFKKMILPSILQKTLPNISYRRPIITLNVSLSSTNWRDVSPFPSTISESTNFARAYDKGTKIIGTKNPPTIGSYMIKHKNATLIYLLATYHMITFHNILSVYSCHLCSFILSLFHAAY